MAVKVATIIDEDAFGPAPDKDRQAAAVRKAEIIIQMICQLLGSAFEHGIRPDLIEKITETAKKPTPQ